MKYHLTIGPIFASNMSPALRQSLREYVPDGFDAKGNFAYNSSMGMTMLGHVVYLLSTHGLIPYTRIGPNPGWDIRYSLQVWPDPLSDDPAHNDDILAELGSKDPARITTLSPGTEESPVLVVPKSENERRIASFDTRVFMSHAMKQLADVMGFRGIKYKRVPTYAAPLDSDDEHILAEAIACEDWWELDTDLTMPGVSSILIDDQGGIYKEGQPYSRRLIPYKGFIMFPEVHYRRSDLAPLGEFDLARAKEFYSRNTLALIASRRFVEWCIAQGCQLALSRVVVDDQ